jgi:TetR/AcrR family transcriptional regulator, transcriptional repressor for nem operon
MASLDSMRQCASGICSISYCSIHYTILPRGLHSVKRYCSICYKTRVFREEPRKTNESFVGRKLEFDYERALERATRVFWAKGYVSASMRDLLKAMGIGEGSFYHLFGGKKRLYLECLKHYNEVVIARRLAALTSEASARKGVRAFFRNVLDELDDPRTPRICLMAQSLSPDVMQESGLDDYVKEQMGGFEEVFVERLRQAKRSGELPPDFPAEVTAAVIVTYLQGFFRVIRVLKNREEMWREMEMLLNSLGL